MSNENPKYVNQVVVIFEGDDQNNVSWRVQADDVIQDTLHLSIDQLARAGAPLAVMGIRALYEILGDSLINLALEKGNLYQCREYIRQYRELDAGAGEGIEGVTDDAASEGVVVH